jgi:hypothetical protein
MAIFASYAGGVFACLALIFSTVRAYSEGATRQQIIYSALLFVLMVILGASGKRSLQTCVLPSLVALNFFSIDRPSADSDGLSNWKARGWAAGVLAAGTIAGLL